MDAALALQMATASIPACSAANANSDGVITSLDALIILQNTIGG